MAIYTTGSGDYEDLAETIAADRNERVVRSIDDLRCDEPVVVVDDINDLTERKLLRLQERQLSSPDLADGFGVITGYDAEHAAELYESSGPDDGTHSLVLKSSDGAVPTDPDAEYLGKGELSAAALEEQAERGLASLTLNAHGWAIHTFLSDGVLCGFPEDVPVDEYDDPQPFCVRDGERDCPLDEDLVSADEISPPHVFVASCSPILSNSLSGLPVHVGTGLLNGAESLIGSYRVVGTYSFESFLHYALLRAGYGVSERAYLLNHNAHSNDIAYAPYVPFGRPSAGLSDPVSNEYDVSFGDENASHTVVVSDVNAHVIDVSLPLSELPTDGDRFYVQVAPETCPDIDVYYVAFEEGEDLRLLVYSTKRLDFDELVLHVDDSPIRADEVRRAKCAVSNAERHRNLGVLSDKGETQLETLREQTRQFPEFAYAQGYDATVRADVSERVNHLRGNVDAIRDELVSNAKRGSYFYEEYAHRAVETDLLRPDESCTNCGRPLFVKVVSDGHRTRRAHGACPQCGPVFDVPVEADDLSSRPEITGELRRGGDERTIVVSFDNPRESPVRATACPALRYDGNTDANDDVVFDPETAEFELSPTESAEVEFELDVSHLPDGQHFVLVKVVADVEIYTANALLRIGDETGFLQPWYR